VISRVRSILFAPGNDAHKLRSALESSAHAVVADLEDAVAPRQKAVSREVVARTYADDAGPLRLIRVNGVDTVWFASDLQLVVDLAPDALVLPKATPDAVEALGPQGPPVVAIVESAQGLRFAYEIASKPRVVALLLGAVDLGVELGLEPRADGAEILYARSKVVVDSAAAGIRAPFDIVHLATRDSEGLEAECSLARSLGFRGKACIHPAQVPVVNRMFAPSEEDVAWAQRVIKSFENAGEGVFSLDGSMVDLPVVERARRILIEAERSAG
jgi:citrate lyase beta subunit